MLSHVSADVHDAVQEAAVALELDPSEFGEVTLRITGATELRNAHGREGMRVIASFGRWSDEDNHGLSVFACDRRGAA